MYRIILSGLVRSLAENHLRNNLLGLYFSIVD